MKRNVHRMYRSCLRCALPLAAAFLVPSVAFAATNLPSSDAGQIGATTPKDTLHSTLPVSEGTAGSASFRLARIDITQDGTTFLCAFRRSAAVPCATPACRASATPALR